MSSVNAQSFSWAKNAGWIGQDAGQGIVTDANDNVILTGYFGGNSKFDNTTLYGQGLFEIFICKYDPNGNLLWAKSAGGKLEDKGKDVKVDSLGNIYICGYFRDTAYFENTMLISAGGSDIFAAKYNANGGLIWARRAGGILNDEANKLGLDDAGNVYLTGFYNGSATFGSQTLITDNGFADIFVTKISSDGTFRWSRRAGGSSEDKGLAIAVGPTGRTVVTGFFYGPADFSGTGLASNGTSDIFLAEYDSSGQLNWVRNAGSPTGDEGHGVGIDNFGSIYLTGYITNVASFDGVNAAAIGYNDVFLAKYDRNGNILWVQSAGGIGLDLGAGLFTNGQGDCYLTGVFANSANFGGKQLSGSDKEIFFAKYDSTGSFKWALSAGNSNGDFGQAITATDNQIAYGTGWYYFTSDFGDHSLPKAQNSDIFITKIDETPVGRWENIPSNSIRIFPNPSTGNITIEGDFSNEPNIRLSLVQTSGKIIKLDPFILEDGKSGITINLQNIPKGIYLIKIENPDSSPIYHKIVRF